MLETALRAGPGEGGRGDDPAAAARGVRVPGLGAEGELAALRGEPAEEPPAGGDRPPRRDDGAAAQAGVQLGDGAQDCSPGSAGPSGRPSGPGGGSRSASNWPTSTRSRRRSATSSTATSSRSCSRAGRWPSMPLALGEVVPGAKRFLIEMVRPGRGGPGLWLSFEEHSGWLVAGIADPGWLPELPPDARDAARLGPGGPVQDGRRRPRPRADRVGPSAPRRRPTTSARKGWSSGPTKARQPRSSTCSGPSPASPPW